MQEVQPVPPVQGQEGRLGVQEVGKTPLAWPPFDAHAAGESLAIDELDLYPLQTHTDRMLLGKGLLSHLHPDHLDLVEEDHRGTGVNREREEEVGVVETILQGLGAGVAMAPLVFPTEPAVECWKVAREVGVRISTHIGSAPGQLEPLAKMGLLGPDTTYIHVRKTSDV